MADEPSVFESKPEDVKRLFQYVFAPPAAEDHVPPATSVDTIAEKPGGRIDRYLLQSVLGEGGMGIVYLAEQEEPVKRQVALKVIKPGMDSKRVIARFEAEQQTLALMEHPHIAHVYDAGLTLSGRPYFVMEYVRGLPITEHCDHYKLTIKERLRLFQQVCQAVQHAHQKGIIHRDIKPSNILVDSENDQAIPKIIDFGVAKAVIQPLTERTLVTEQGQLFGTPEYMSPEQANMASEDIDTRSDVYSLGVLLYVLLTGCLPFDSDTLREGGIENIQKTIRETDPKTPSTRLMKLGDEARTIAQSRRMEIQTLAKHLRKELEWIPLRAIRKERAERYRSASELADDIENYLKGAPLIAGPLGTGYKLKKFVRRNRVLVGGIAAVLAVLVGGIVVSTLFAIGQARVLAEKQLILDFLKSDVLGSADEARVGEATISYMLDAASEKLDRFSDKPLVEAELCLTLGETYRRLGEYKQAEQHKLRATEIYRQHYGEEHPDTLGAMSSIGWIYSKQGRYHDMERLWTRILRIEQRVSGVRQQLGTMNGLAVAYFCLGKYKEAESLLEKTLELVRCELNEEDFSLLPWIKSNLANVYMALGRSEKAERLILEALANDGWLWQPYTGPLAAIYQVQGRFAKAEPLLVKALEEARQLRGDEHFDTLSRFNRLVQFYVDQDRYEEAQELLNEALPIARKLFRKEHPMTLSFVNAYAVLHTKQKQYDQAEILFDEALKGRQRELGNDHPGTLNTLNDLGVLRREQHRYDEAESLLRQALEGRKRKLGNDHPACFGSMHELAVLHIQKNRHQEAEKLLIPVVEGRLVKLGEGHPHTQESLNNLIEVCEALGKLEEAEEWRAKLPQTEAMEE